MSFKPTRQDVFTILILAFALRVGYAIVTPPFQAPDEYAHFSYAKLIWTFGELPVQPDPVFRHEQLQWHQPPLYYVLAAMIFPSTNWMQGRPVLPIRFLNILFSMLTICIAYWCASEFFQKNRFAVLMTCALVAFVPTYIYVSATMSNGTLATFFTSLGLYLGMKSVVEENERRKRWLWVGIVAGLAVLSKLTAMTFVPAVGLFLFLLSFRSRNWRQAAYRFLWFLAGVLSIAGWWFLRNWQLYGRALTLVENGYRTDPQAIDWEAPNLILLSIFNTFWAVFGRVNDVHFTDIHIFYLCFSGLAAFGLLLFAIREQRGLPVKGVTFWTVSIAAALAGTLYYAHNYDSGQGRYLFPVLIPIMTFMTIGFSALVPERFQVAVMKIMLFTLAGINVVVLYRMAAFYYG